MNAVRAAHGCIPAVWEDADDFAVAPDGAQQEESMNSPWICPGSLLFRLVTSTPI